MINPLQAISPLDGRYHSTVSELQSIASEFGLIKYRLIAELEWFQLLANHPKIAGEIALQQQQQIFLKNMIADFSLESAQRIKEIEKVTNHDIKALEYYIAEQFQLDPVLREKTQWIHFSCTSEDINNIAHALMLKAIRAKTLDLIQSIIEQLRTFAHRYADLAMLSHTHGQPASPTTLGKEFANYHYRLSQAKLDIEKSPIRAKINGAVGNFNAHCAAFPDLDWLGISRQFISEKLGLEYTPYTTQIENHDYMSVLFDSIARFNSILIDFNRDIWSYISMDYIRQSLTKGEVGSSTMPHKINPINFENSEGNLGIANALLQYLSQKLPISRLQRDLTDSTTLRNFGVAFGYSWLAYKNCLLGLSKIKANTEKIEQDLANQVVLLAEPIQTILRKKGVQNAYEILKEMTRGQIVTQQGLSAFIDQLEEVDEETKRELKTLEVNKYIGLAAELARKV